MTSSFAQPLEIKHDRVDPAILKVVTKIDEVARKCDTRYFMAGATAREIMLRMCLAGAGKTNTGCRFWYRGSKLGTIRSIEIRSHQPSRLRS